MHSSGRFCLIGQDLDQYYSKSHCGLEEIMLIRDQYEQTRQTCQLGFFRCIIIKIYNLHIRLNLFGDQLHRLKLMRTGHWGIMQAFFVVNG